MKSGIRNLAHKIKPSFFTRPPSLPKKIQTVSEVALSSMCPEGFTFFPTFQAIAQHIQKLGAEERYEMAFFSLKNNTWKNSQEVSAAIFFLDPKDQAHSLCCLSTPQGPTPINPGGRDVIHQNILEKGYGETHFVCLSSLSDLCPEGFTFFASFDQLKKHTRATSQMKHDIVFFFRKNTAWEQTQQLDTYMMAPESGKHISSISVLYPPKNPTPIDLDKGYLIRQPIAEKGYGTEHFVCIKASQ